MIQYSAVAIILLSALIQATFQLTSGTLLLLYHASLGRHIKKRTKTLTSSFIVAVSIITFLMLTAIYFIFNCIFHQTIAPEYLLAVIAILVVLAIIIWFFYYRSGKSTQLWLPASVTRYITQRAKNTDSSTEAFALGLLASFAEMPLTLVITVIAANSLCELPFQQQLPVALAYVLISVLPLLLMKLFIRRGKTVTDVQRWRTHNKTFLKFITCVGFLTLACFLLAFRIMGEI